MSSRRTKVLLIEDDPLHAQIIAGFLQTDTGSVELTVVERLSDGLARVAQGEIDLVLLDLGLPDSEGLATFAQLHEFAPRLPIIVLTALAEEQFALSAMQAGAQDYLVKWQLNSATLQRAIRYAIKRKYAELTWHGQAQAIRQLADALPEIVCLHDVQSGRVIYANQQARDLLGQQAALSEAGQFAANVHPEDAAKLQDQLARLQSLRQGTVVEVEFRVADADGNWHWLDSRMIVYRRTVSGQPQEILCTAYDVTMRKRAEKELQASEDRYRDLVENSGLYIGTHDDRGRILSANQSVLNFLGLPDAKILQGVAMEDFLTGRSKSDFQVYLQTVLAKGQASGLASFRNRDGQQILIEFTNSVRSDGSGARIVRSIGRDVTKRARAENALRESKERLELALNAARMGAWEWNIVNDTLVGDEYARALIDVGSNGMTQALAFVHPDDLESVQTQIQYTLANNREFQRQFRIVRADGETRWVEVHARVLLDEKDAPRRAIGVVQDITERRLLEAQLLRSQRLESIGALASGIAHDLNNVLAPIVMAIHTLQQRFTDETSQRWLSIIRRSSERGRELIDKVVAFAKGASGELLPLRPANLIEEVGKMLQETFPKNVELQIEIAPDLWEVQGDATQLHQVLMNLCLNARDAMPDGGKLTISAGNSQLGEKDVRLLPDASPGTYVQILVQDSGVGIPPQLLDRVFEPFFTTKEVGKGSGLGLSTVLGIVRAHGGFVNLQSQPGAGTQFYVYLPAQELTTLVTEDVPERAISRGMGETILIVDDEENVREVLRFTLEASGYRTLVACDGVEAVAIYRQHYQEVQLVLTDMAMPNLDGPSAIRQMKEINPLVEVIATSGVKTTGKLDEAMKAGAITFLPKPYTAERLLSVLEEILRRQPGK